MKTNYVTYISRFYFENYKCFKGENDFSLLDENNNLIQWTVILGNNNSGKTNILKAIADLEPNLLKVGKNQEVDEDKKSCAPLNLFRNIHIERSKSNNEKKKEITFIGCDILFKNKSSNKSYFKGDFNLFEKKRKNNKSNRPNWGFEPNSMWSGGDFNVLNNLKIYGYGVTRRAGTKGLVEDDFALNSSTLFYPEKSLINIEDWLLQLDYASKNGQRKASETLEKVRDLIKCGVFPDIYDFKFDSSEKLKNNILFKTKSGWCKLDELGYGYQSTLSWLIDFCKKMFERYSRSKNPLAEPAILLLDEIDLHLHPNWQKNVVQFLSNIFPATQFIVTSHSPLVLQSIEKLI